MATLVARDLTMEFSSTGYVVRPLNGFSFSADDGELVVLLGPSGRGTTTLLSCLAGLLTPTSGSIMFDGSEVTGLSGSALSGYRSRAHPHDHQQRPAERHGGRQRSAADRASEQRHRGHDRQLGRTLRPGAQSSERVGSRVRQRRCHAAGLSAHGHRRGFKRREQPGWEERHGQACLSKAGAEVPRTAPTPHQVQLLPTSPGWSWRVSPRGWSGKGTVDIGPGFVGRASYAEPARDR